jgi:quinolinate synthase
MNSRNPVASERTRTLGRIADLKRHLGDKLLIFAHFYQSDEILSFADFTGDSLQLAQEAARRKDRKFLVVCAVSFMAEMVRILCDPSQTVLHPDENARCPLADMAEIGTVETVWRGLQARYAGLIPVVYVNSTSELKAFCGRHGGAVCTSSNAQRVFQWVFAQGGRVFFLPDENLGRNTASRLGIHSREVVQVDPDQWQIEGPSELPADPKVLVWKGYCYVHKHFLLSQIDAVRLAYPGIKIAVHPECVPEVCNVADLIGATSVIKKTVEESETGARWAIGTEWNLVNRLQVAMPDKYVVPLLESRCEEMAMITPENLLNVLEGISRSEMGNMVRVGTEVAGDARRALSRMLEIG